MSQNISCPSSGIWSRIKAFFCNKVHPSLKKGAKSVAAGTINTAKFLTDAQYRQDVGYPWLQSVWRENWPKVQQEVGESQEMFQILWKYAQGKDVTVEEKKAAEEQLWDLVRVIPALAIFLLPGGAVWLPLLAKALPWDLIPSAFRTKEEPEKKSER